MRPAVQPAGRPRNRPGGGDSDDKPTCKPARAGFCGVAEMWLPLSLPPGEPGAPPSRGEGAAGERREISAEERAFGKKTAPEASNGIQLNYLNED